MDEFRESSTLSRMQEQYWTTKQAVFKKLGRKEDDCIIASDAELDTKLELFQTIEESFFTLMRVLENYQDKLCVLAQEENAMGRFLKENGKYDKTRAGKVMCDAGKALSFSAQQKLSLRLPLVRLYHEVETFQYRAIVDTLQTIEKMEKSRTAYRGALMWMKDVSQQLDPDTCKQMEKFRKVQSNVRKSKGRFDKLKLDTLQKVDLLSFSRCNLFSQALAAYQNTLINISKKMAHTIASVAETTKGYQHYEFSVLKELTETSKKVADDISDMNQLTPDEKTHLATEDKDVLLFFESEYFDEEVKKKEKTVKDTISEDRILNNSNPKDNNQPIQENKRDEPASLVNIENEECFEKPKLKQSYLHSVKDLKAMPIDSDLLTGLEMNNIDKNDLELLQEILDSNCSIDSSQLIDSKSQDKSCDYFSVNQINETNKLFSTIENSHSYFMPSQLIDKSKQHTSQIVSDSSTGTSSGTSKSLGLDAIEKSKKSKQDMSSWYNLFADLDPVANPDLIGKKSNEEFGC